MSVERKCLNCNTWNEDNDYCTSCGKPVSPVVIEDIREKAREERRYKEPTKFDIFLQNWKNSNNIFLKILYKVLYTIGFIFLSIASFFAWLAASPNG